MILRPQDIVALAKIEAMAGQPWTYSSLAAMLKISPSNLHEGLRTAASSHLYDPVRKLPIRRNLLEFLVHGIKYCFPPKRGQLVRGVPTSYAASPLVSLFAPSGEPPPVWPYAEGVVRGVSFEPLYPTVPIAAMADPRLGEMLVLIDAIRDGRPRESKAAVDELTKRLQAQ